LTGIMRRGKERGRGEVMEAQNDGFRLRKKKSRVTSLEREEERDLSSQKKGRGGPREERKKKKERKGKLQ